MCTHAYMYLFAETKFWKKLNFYARNVYTDKESVFQIQKLFPMGPKATMSAQNNRRMTHLVIIFVCTSTGTGQTDQIY